MHYSIHIAASAIEDIQKVIDYYDEQEIGLGEKFEKAINRHFLSIRKNPFFQVRYDSIRCLPIKKFPFMIHFVVNEERERVNVIAVLHTSLNPDANWIKR